MTLKSLELIRKKKNEISLFFLYAISLIPSPVLSQLKEFNDELKTAGEDLGNTAEYVLIIVKIMAGAASIVGLIVFIAYREGNSDVAGKAGKWGIGLVMFVVGMAIVKKVFFGSTSTL